MAAGGGADVWEGKPELVRIGALFSVSFILLVGGLSAGLAHALAPDKAFHQYVLDTWSIEEGLPQISVTALVQGPDGYIWAGTQAGVARFDGVRFKHFDPRSSPNMPGMFIQDLFVDSQDRVWTGTYKGAAVFRDGGFHAVDDGFGREIDVFQFAETTRGEVILASDRGLLRLGDDAFVNREGDPDDALRSVFAHGEDLYAGGYGVIHRQRDGQWQSMHLGEAFESALVNDFIAYDGRVWAATTRGLLYIDDGRWRPFRVPGELTDDVIETLFADRDGNLWLGAAGRLLRIQGRELVESVPDEVPYAHGSVLAMTEDHEGNLWLGSRWEGLARLWNGWVFRYDRPEGLHNSLVWTVARDGDGRVWTGTMDGLATFSDGRFERQVAGSEQPHPHAYTVLPEPERVWVGTRTGLYWWNRRDQRVEKPPAFDVLDSAQVNGIIAHDDDYWLATTEGVWRFDGERMRRAVPRDALGGRDVRLLYETRDGSLLAGTRRGLLYWHRDRFRKYRDVAVDRDVTAILELSDGRLVVGTLDEKLYIGRDDEWHEFDADDGLPTNSPFAFGETDGRLWVAGIRGIYELPLDSIRQYVDGEIERLPGRMVLNERGDVSGAQKGYCCNGAGNAKGFMHEGEFWLPTRGGIVHLVPDRIARNPEPPRVHIDRVRIGQEWRALEPGQPLELPAERRDLAFGLGVLSYQDPTSVQVEYRLKGFRKDWQRLDEPMQRQIFYTNLPSGRFTLQLRASNNAGVWSESPTGLDFRIRPRLWETMWFQSVMLFLLLLLIWLGFNYRLRNMQRQQRALEGMVADRTEQLRVANEHLRDYSARLETASMTDPLTGLWNRRFLSSQLPADLAHFHRELSKMQMRDSVMVFAIVDIDLFKQINDRHGHDAGDDVLQQFARLLERLVRTGDYIVRWGGEEFLIVFRPMPTDEVTRVATRIVEGIADHGFMLDGGRILRLTASMGLAEYPPFRDSPSAMDWNQAVTLADKALLHVKQEGRDGWCRVRPAPWVEPAALSGHLDRGLRELLQDEEVSVERG